MADILLHAQNCNKSVIYTYTGIIIKNVNCEKCLELKYQLKETVQELSSDRLII